MEIKLQEIPIQDMVRYSKHLKECRGYIDKEEEGVYGMGGRLNIRPIYQREFIYKPTQRNAVIDTVRNNFPLNVLYWVENKDGSYEVLDGQQRLISIGQYVSSVFAIEWPNTGNLYFHNLTEDQQNQILNYKLMVYFCEGTDKEKLDWFKTINIAGEKLADQELRNAIYTGTWLSDAKKYFSKTGCPAYDIARDYIKGSPIRQDYLETTINWISDGEVEEYMAKHQHKPNANELWLYFKAIINWVKTIFPNYRKEMKGINFGGLYNEFKLIELDSDKLEKEITELMLDEDVTKKSGIYSYVLTKNEKFLNIRSFSDSNKREVYEKQKGICIKCKEYFKIEEMEADHITPWCEGGNTTSENCQLLCKHDNRIKSEK